jgi:hypothetical protein
MNSTVTGSWRRWRALGPADRELRRRAFVLLAAARAGAPLLAIGPLRRRLRALAGRAPRGAATPAAVGRAVDSAARRLPGSRCLARALAAEALLLRHGLPASLLLGVARAGPGGIEAHAWVLSGREAVAGGGEVDRFAAVALAPER